jgi:hypothetical protein
MESSDKADWRESANLQRRNNPPATRIAKLLILTSAIVPAIRRAIHPATLGGIFAATIALSAVSGKKVHRQQGAQPASPACNYNIFGLPVAFWDFRHLYCKWDWPGAHGSGNLK